MGEFIPIRCTEIEWLHPLAVSAFSRLCTELERDFVMGNCPVAFRVFETYRTPQRQAYLFRRGSTKAMAFRSAHQFGLAVDMVPWSVDRGYHWDPPSLAWDRLRRIATTVGLKNEIPWDRAHVEHPLWDKVRPVLLYQTT